MIVVVDAFNREKYADLVEEMFCLRARVFQDRLGWAVTVRNGQERDMFDDLDPAYVIALDADGDVVGCMRLLQTTGPHMMSDVFADLLDGQPPLRSSRLWEATRFCVDTRKLTGARSGSSIAYVTSEVMIGAFEYARDAGVTDAVAVIDPVMNRVMRRSANAPYDYLGSPKQMGKVVAMAALMDCSAERINAIRSHAGIIGDVMASDAEIEALLEQRRPAPRPHPVVTSEIELAEYFSQQMKDAENEDETNAVYRLIDALGYDKLSADQLTG